MKTITLLALAFVIQAGGVAAQQAPAGTNNPATKRVAFAQSCFWTGEMKLGQIEGVVRTEAGFIGRREVTLVSRLPPTRVSPLRPANCTVPNCSVT